MKITIVMVMSLDGRTTKGPEGQPYTWASPEDQAMFRQCITDADCIVMGSQTYRASREGIRRNPGKPRFVLTRTPEQFQADADIAGLTFTSASPLEIRQRCQERGYQNVLLAGGAQTNARFIDTGAADELLLTVEPRLFGSGTPLVGGIQHAGRLRLLGSKQLNAQGTLLLRYQINSEG